MKAEIKFLDPKRTFKHVVILISPDLRKKILGDKLTTEIEKGQLIFREPGDLDHSVKITKYNRFLFYHHKAKHFIGSWDVKYESERFVLCPPDEDEEN